MRQVLFYLNTSSFVIITFLRTCDKNVFTYLPEFVRHDSFGKKKELLLFTCFSSLSLFLFFRANLLTERVFVFLFSRGGLDLSQEKIKIFLVVNFYTSDG